MCDVMLMLRRHHKPLSPKACACLAVGAAAAIVMQITLPKIFKKADAKLISNIAWSIGLVVALVLVFAI